MALKSKRPLKWGEMIKNQVLIEPRITRIEGVTTLYFWTLDLNWYAVFESQEVFVIKVDNIILVLLEAILI